MTRRRSPGSAPGSLARTGAACALMIGLSITAAACASSSSAVGAEVEAIYEQAQGLGAEEIESREIRDIAILEWALESGILERAFTVDSLMSARHEASASGYGARGTDLWPEYQDFIEQQSQSLKDEIRDGLTVDDVRAYYAQHPERFEKQDDMTVEIIDWEDGRATSTYSVDITAANVRELQESDDRLMSVALDLAQNERATVDRGDGRYAQILCVTRVSAGVAPFDEVVQAAAAQRASDVFDSELDRRVAALSNRQ